MGDRAGTCEVGGEVVSDKARRGRAAVVLVVLAAVIGVLPWLLGDPWWVGPAIIGGTVAAFALAWLTMCWMYDEWPRR